MKPPTAPLGPHLSTDSCTWVVSKFPSLGIGETESWGEWFAALFLEKCVQSLRCLHIGAPIRQSLARYPYVGLEEAQEHQYPGHTVGSLAWQKSAPGTQPSSPGPRDWLCPPHTHTIWLTVHAPQGLS